MRNKQTLPLNSMGLEMYETASINVILSNPTGWTMNYPCTHIPSGGNEVSECVEAIGQVWRRQRGLRSRRRFCGVMRRSRLLLISSATLWRGSRDEDELHINLHGGSPPLYECRLEGIRIHISSMSRTWRSHWGIQLCGERGEEQRSKQSFV